MGDGHVSVFAQTKYLNLNFQKTVHTESSEILALQSKKEDKDQKSIQSSTTLTQDTNGKVTSS